MVAIQMIFLAFFSLSIEIQHYSHQINTLNAMSWSCSELSPVTSPTNGGPTWLGREGIGCQSQITWVQMPASVLFLGTINSFGQINFVLCALVSL